MSFDPAKGYTGVLTQQGRVQLDADWNDQRELVQRAIRIVLRDLLEGNWAPPSNPGFGLRPVVALRFEGNNRVLLDESGALAPSGEDQHTLELWLTWSGGAGVLVDCGAADGSLGYELAIEENGTLVLALSVRERTGSTLRLYSSAPLPVGKPAHLAVVVGSDYGALVLDGNQVARSRHSGLPDVEAPMIVVGGRISDAPSAGFRGFIAAIRVWSVARTLAQLAEAGPVAPTAEWETTDPGLLALWTFDATTGSPLDDTAAGRAATIGGSGQASWHLADLVVEPGRFYVDGVLCELSDPTSYTSQPGAGGQLPTSGLHEAYLEVWEEVVTPVEDPTLREVALGGLDPSVRTRMATRVRLHKINEKDHADAAPEQTHTGRMAAEHTGHSVPGNHLYRVEIHESGELGGESPATFKWSRDNGASLFAVAPTDSPNVVTLAYAAADVAPLAPDDVVEPLPAGAPLDGPAHPLLQVIDVSATDGKITLDQAPPVDTSLLRRWDNRARGGATSAVAGAELPVESDWVALEDGIQVQFQGGRFRRGDYWWIRARMDLPGVIDWPQQSGHPQALDPDGVERLRAPLARLSLLNGEIEIEDLRPMTSPVPAFGAGPKVWRSEAEPSAGPPELASPPAGPGTGPVDTTTEGVLEDADEPGVEVDLEVLAGIEEDDSPPAHARAGPTTASAGVSQNVPAVATAAAMFEPAGYEAESEPVESEPLDLEPDWSERADFDPTESEPAETEPLDFEPDWSEPAESEPASSEAPRVWTEPAEPEWTEPAEPEPASPSASVETAAKTGWSHIGGLDLAGGELRSAVSAAESIVLLTERGLFALSVSQGQASKLADVPASRRGSELLAVERLLLLVGGGHDEDRPDGRLFAFELDVARWTERTPIPVRRARPAHAIANGQLHVVGGHSRAVRQRVHGTHHIYEPTADRWHEALELPTPRAGATAAALGNRVHVVGGHGATRREPPHVAHESFDLGNGRWQAEPPLPEARHVVSSTAHGDRHVVVLAAHEVHHANGPNDVIAFNPANRTWEGMPPLPSHLRRSIVVSHDRRLLAFGTRADGGVEIHEHT